MTKKIAIIFISLVILLAIGVGIYLSLGKKTPVLPKTLVTLQNYVNPTFGYALKIPDQYEMRSQTVPEEIKKQGVDRSCLTLKTDTSCIITLDSLPNSTNSTLEFIIDDIKNHDSGYLKKAVLGNHPAATWQEKSTVNYILVTKKAIFRLSFDAKYSQPAKSILETIKL